MINILIVDDEKNVCSALKSILEFSGKYSVMTASNGLEGLELFENSKPDLLITDVRIPIKDGLWLIDHVRSLDENIPIVMMSGFTSASSQEIYSRRTQAFMRKPDDVAHIVDIVTNLVTTH